MATFVKCVKTSCCFFPWCRRCPWRQEQISPSNHYNNQTRWSGWQVSWNWIY